MLLVGMWYGSTAMENSLVAFQKVKHRITVWPSSSAPRYISKETKPYAYTDSNVALLIIV